MLTVHGLVLVADDNIQELNYQYTTILKFQVASDDGKGNTTRHYIDLYVPKEKAAEAKDRIKLGKVCEIVHGTWNEVYGRQTNTEDPNARRYSRVELKVKWEHFKVLSLCVYYEGIPGVTEKAES